VQHLGASADERQSVHLTLRRLLDLHSAWMRPVLDEQGVDLALALAALLGEGDGQTARNVVRGVTNMLRLALNAPEFLPVDSDLLEDAIALQIVGDVEDRRFFELTTVIPMLGSVAAFMGDDVSLGLVRGLQPQLEDVSLEQWWPTTALETYTGGQVPLRAVGVSRLLARLGASAVDEQQASLTPPEGAHGPEAFRWHDTPWAVLVALSARLHRHPVPTWFLARAAQGWPLPEAAADAAPAPEENGPPAAAPQGEETPPPGA
jgi:hypothetical protein